MAETALVNAATQGTDVPKMTQAVIDPEGDVYLQLENMELRVSSKILATASKVFNAMFKSNFQEGLTLAKGEICHIPLSDDPTAMHILCVVTHFREMPTTLAKTELKYLGQVVILADKYGCATAIRYWADSCMERINDLEGSDENHMVDSLLAAYVLNQSTRFKDITKRMVYFRPSKDSDLGQRGWNFSKAARDILPCTLIPTIIQHEKRIKHELYDRIEELVSYLIHLESSDSDEANHQDLFSWGPYNRSQYLKEQRSNLENCDDCSVVDYLLCLKRNGIWPIASTFQEKMLGQILKDLGDYKNSDKICDRCNLDLSKIIKTYVQVARVIFLGLCLDCVKHRSRGSEKPYACRFKHSKSSPYLGLEDVFYGTGFAQQG